LLVPSLLLVLVSGLLAIAAPLLRTERAGLWTMLVLSLASIMLAAWRPKIGRKQ
jgi:hypothetical protein